MTGGISFNVTGGKANIGNVGQGDHNNFGSVTQSIASPADEAFDAVFKELAADRDKQANRQTELEGLEAELKALQAALQQGKQSKWGSVADAAKGIYEKYGWAGEPLRKLFMVLVPGFLGL